MNSKLGGMLEELERIENKIQNLDSYIEKLEEEAVVKELKRKYKIREILLEDLKLLREHIKGNCNHLYYFMGLENGRPYGICLHCLTKGEINEEDQVFQVLHPAFNDMENKYSFMVLFDELHSIMKKESSKTAFVRKYQHHINKPKLQMVRDYPY